MAFPNTPATCFQPCLCWTRKVRVRVRVCVRTCARVFKCASYVCVCVRAHVCECVRVRVRMSVCTYMCL